MKKVERIFGSILVLVATLLIGMVTGGSIVEKEILYQEALAEEVEEVVEDTVYVPLTEWQLLQLAIIRTESNFNTRAVGTKGDLGLFQITEIYVEECNRLKEAPIWVHTDAFVPERAVQMFNWYQSKHNPEQDYIRAINVHNPGGESIGYSQKVLANMEAIQQYENIRRIIVTSNNK